MSDKREVLALIPARGNSKSIPRKNIRDLGGYPLIAYSIAAGLQASCVTRTIVSTDDAEIAEIARAYGAETPFLRPEEFSRDDTQDLPVFKHALKWLAENEHYQPDVVILLLEHPGADSVRGVVPSGQNPFKMWRVGPDGSMRPLLTVEGIKEAYNAPRQQLPDTYWQTGHIDAIRPDAILNKNSMSGDVILPLFIEPAYTVDIDTLLDWQNAESTIYSGRLDIVMPGYRRRPFPGRVKLLVMDFDGVMTDDRVWVDQEGHEMVAANRSDGLGLERLRTLTDVQAVVISRESNPVVAARCKKLKLTVLQNIQDKAQALQNLLIEMKISAGEVIYVGNDLNDLPCFPLVGYAVVPGDALEGIKRRADHVLQKAGGLGAVREICELIIEKNGGNA